MKRNNFVIMIAIILALTFSFAFTGCKKAEKAVPVVTEQKKSDAEPIDKTAEMKKEVDNASGFNFK